MNYHLVLLKKPYLDAILAGRKQVESRFTRTRRHFFAGVRPGDVLFLKQSSGPVCARARVAAVKSFEGLTPAKIAEIRRRYNGEIVGSNEYWQSREGCKFGLLVWLEGAEPIEPVRIDKKDWRAWVTLSQKQDFGLIAPSIGTEKD